ncbi:MAG: twin-arginine protein translocation system subunit TatC [Methanomethylovorans sp. PtaU1.Bin073]|nr:MAG: twin-arginine protein translocation system subunit TatC [Methanomethylovorans sp. PtaU1.Bin073]
MKNEKDIANKTGVAGDYTEPAISHLAELRNRLMVVIIAMFVFMLVSYPVSGYLMKYVWNMFLGSSTEMAIYSPLEWIYARLEVSFLLAIAFTFPFLFYEMFRFAARGLYPNERKFIKSIVPASFLFFLAGSIVAVNFIMPLMFKYIILSSDTVAQSQISVKQTISIAVTLIAGAGLVFQIPVIMFFAVKMQLIRRETLRKMRILVYTSFFTFILFLSPDPTFIAQLVCACLLVILFEIGLLFSRFY